MLILISMAWGWVTVLRAQKASKFSLFFALLRSKLSFYLGECNLCAVWILTWNKQLICIMRSFSFKLLVCRDLTLGMITSKSSQKGACSSWLRRVSIILQGFVNVSASNQENPLRKKKIQLDKSNSWEMTTVRGENCLNCFKLVSLLLVGEED